MSGQDPKISWVEGQNVGVGPCPNAKDLLGTLVTWRKFGVDMIVSAQPENEARSLGLENEATYARTAKLDFMRIPIPDHTAPPFTRDVLDAIETIADYVRSGKRVYIHCFAGIGRSPALAAAVLVRNGMNPREAVQALRKARGIPVPETGEQLDFIFNYAEYVASERQRDE